MIRRPNPQRPPATPEFWAKWDWCILGVLALGFASFLSWCCGRGM
jgi:hypothetical protein